MICCQVKCTRLSLDTIKRRLQQTNKYQSSSLGAGSGEKNPPLFVSHVVLALPNIVMKLSLDEIQVYCLFYNVLLCLDCSIYKAFLNKAIEVILTATKDVKIWKYAEIHKLQQKMEADAARKWEKILKHKSNRSNHMISK